jgi:ribosomal protein S18 acetylase RimI-like enzyme
MRKRTVLDEGRGRRAGVVGQLRSRPARRRGRIARMATVGIELGLARPGDAPALARMSRDLIETGLGWDYVPRRIERLIGERATTTLVARAAERIAGFAVMSFGDERAHLVLLAVQPTHQRRGIARRMLAWLLESAAIAGIATVDVELRVANAPARAFYRAAGFVETVEMPGYYRGRESAVRMSLARRAPGALPAFPWPPAGDGR